ncbi:PLC-like phosphodiesterase [Dentipellis sp. KUC8613]|nr:PLC-like phosphodiesterase [Dentipellis sp. KUC8613]
MPDSLALSAVCLPGTHDTMAFYGWPMSQCQSGDTPLSVQLVSGIRVLDIRLAVKKGHLISYHGQYPQRTPFSSILRDLQEFLTSPKSSRETVVVSVKQEDYDDTPPRDFSATVRKEIEESPGGMGLWYLKNKVPLLGEVRGKAVMFSRFGGDGAEWEGGLEGLGIHPTTWPDSDKEGFSWELKNTLIRTQDWYHIPSFLSIPEKVDLATTMLVPPAAAESDIPVLSITYFSASSFPLAAPTVVSTGFGWPSIGLGVDGVNTLVGRWLLDMFSGHEDAGARGVEKRDVTDGPKLRGWTFMDFFTEPVGSEVVPLLVECNFRGRSDEEGWLQR